MAGLNLIETVPGRSKLGRQGKSRDGRWSDVTEEIEIFGLTGHPVLALPGESSMISKHRAPSAYPKAAQNPPLLVLLQYDNYMP